MNLEQAVTNSVACPQCDAAPGVGCATSNGWGYHLERFKAANVPENPNAEPANRPPDLVNHPPHYTSHPSGVECITITEHMNFCVGNAIKYLFRAGLKTSSPLEDLRKAEWYVRREIARLEKASASSRPA